MQRGINNSCRSYLNQRCEFIQYFSGKLANYAIIICIRIDIYMKRFISFHQISSIRDDQYKSIVSICIDFYRSSIEVLGVTWRNEGS